MRFRYCLPLLFCLFLPEPSAGQVRIVGRVIEDETLLPIGFAEVALRSSGGATLARTEADEFGNFEFTTRRTSPVRLHASRLGYEETTTPVLFFDTHNLLQVEIRLDPDAILLAPLEIVAWAELIDNAVLEGFWNRVETGLGHYITREDVEARNPGKVTDLLRDLPGVQISGGSVGNRPSIRMARASNRNCATQIFVDGFLVNRRMTQPNGTRGPEDIRIDDVVSPVSVEGIEVYGGLSTVPAEFLNPDAECGVIAIWTKRGGRR
jgi:hypothetical protein